MTSAQQVSGDEWPQLLFEATPGMVPMLEDMLFAAGALSVMLTDTQDQPVLEPEPGEIRLWQSLRVTGLFAQGASLESILTRCRSACPVALPDFRVLNLPDEDWQRAWMSHFKATAFGRYVWICPTHDSVESTEAVVISLDPGLAFGSGTHPTTALCLHWLDAICPETFADVGQTLAGQTVVDYGCGSGILAIAAARLGASRVIAVDIDEQALTATRENARRNGVEDRIETCLPDTQVLLQAAGQVDLMIANILFNPLLELRPIFAGLMRDNATLVVSGLLQDQVDELMLHYTQGFVRPKFRQLDGWALVQANRHVRDDAT